MPKYHVEVPIYGTATVEVEASCEKEAVKIGIDVANELLARTESPNDTGCLQGLNAYNRILRGNVWMGDGPYETSAEKIEDDEESD